jgi:hypothetical protein
VELTILMPCLNEANTVAACVRAATRFLTESAINGEVVVADNGSTDGSVEIAAAAGARVVHVPVRGYGAALMAGINNARGEYVIMGDADSSYDFSRLEPYVARLRAGAELVMGNRFQGGIEAGAMPPLHRYLGNPVLSFLGRLFFRIPIGDFHCGMRGFSKRAIQRLGLVTAGMEFASEMVAKAALARLRVEEVPTTLQPDGRDRLPHLRTWRDGWRHLRFLLLFCPRWLFLYPGILLLVTGSAGLALDLTSLLGLTAPILGVHSLLYMAAATMLGVQTLQFALLTKWIGVLGGIVPEPPWMGRWAGQLSVEKGLVIGFALFVLGVAWAARLTFDWGRTGFGALDAAETMRSVIPSVTLMVVGMQTAVGAMFAGAVHFSWRSAFGRPR